MRSLICHAILRLIGWGFEGKLPESGPYLVLGGPHTSNWDFVMVLLYKYALKNPIKYMAKQSLFKPAYGWFFRMTGGLPVNRKSSENKVEQAINHFKQDPKLILGLAPEGTRSKVAKLRSGFYYIARGANMPVVLIAIDFGGKKMVFHKPRMMSDNVEDELNWVRTEFANVKGKRPEFGIKDLDSST